MNLNCKLCNNKLISKSINTLICEHCIFTNSGESAILVHHYDGVISMYDIIFEIEFDDTSYIAPYIELLYYSHLEIMLWSYKSNYRLTTIEMPKISYEDLKIENFGFEMFKKAQLFQ